MSRHNEILSKYGVRAKKSLGQNFLVHEPSLDAIATAVAVEGASIIEVGPGYGALTERLLAAQPKKLSLVELDKDMIAIIEDRIKQGDLLVPAETDFQIISGDILKYSPDFLKYSVIANIPYYITSPILFRFLYEVAKRPESMVILMQKEVAERIRATDGKQSYLSLFCQMACESIEMITKVPANCFIPAPKVDSAVLRFVLKKEFDPESALKMLKIFSAGFSAPRKKLSSNLSGGLGIPKDIIASMLEALGLREDVRPEAVSLEDWLKVAGKLAK